MVAAHQGHLEVARFLLEAGADKDVANKRGHSALAIATAQGHGEVARLLVEAGAVLK